MTRPVPPQLKPFVKGDPRINRTIPGPGRPKNEFKELCRQLATGERTIAQVEEILADKSHPAFVAALKWATENGYGKATEHVEHTGVNGGPMAMTVTFVAKK